MAIRFNRACRKPGACRLLRPGGDSGDFEGCTEAATCHCQRGCGGSLPAAPAEMSPRSARLAATAPPPPPSPPSGRGASSRSGSRLRGGRSGGGCFGGGGSSSSSSSGGPASSSLAWVPTPQGLRRPVVTPMPAPPPEPADPQLSDEECARRLQLEFDREVAEKVERASFKCPLCFETTTFDDSVELDCEHRLCATCFRGYLEVHIREKRVAAEELVCPMPGCGCEVTVPQVEGVTKGSPLWDRFLAARAELWQPTSTDGERLCECPAKGCGMKFLAPGGASRHFVHCPECNTGFCRDCGCQHPGSTCEAHRQWRKENDSAERAFDQLMQDKHWQRCPHCQAACERFQGCNFMTCHSATCRGKFHFCYICGEKLEMEHHYSHFPYGLFANGCLRIDNRSEVAATLPATTRRTQRRQRPDVDSNWLTRTLEGLEGFVRDWAHGERAQGEH